MPVERFERAAIAASPWKNGGGLTREIVRRPAGSGLDAFDWRISMAEIASSGAFSPFPGVDRIILLTNGAGVHLSSADDSVDHDLSTPLTPFTFSGETPITATLLGGSSSDFNVMTRRSTTRADLEIVRDAGAIAECMGGLLLSCEGSWCATPTKRRGDALTLGPDTGVWWDGESLAWTVEPDHGNAAVIAVRITLLTMCPARAASRR